MSRLDPYEQVGSLWAGWIPTRTKSGGFCLAMSRLLCFGWTFTGGLFVGIFFRFGKFLGFKGIFLKFFAQPKEKHGLTKKNGFPATNIP